MIWELERKGHEIKIVTRHKEITIELLDAYGFEYEVIASHFKSLLGKLINVPKTDLAILKVAKKFKPDILTGILDMYNAHVGKLIGKPCITFTDTEHAKLGNLITLPFVTAVYTPQTFKIDLGKKQIRYKSFHELAYLHPNYFKPDPTVLNELGLTKNDKYIVMRFISFDAGHDIGYGSFDFDLWNKMIKELDKHYIVYLTSEKEIQPAFKKYELKLPPQKIHDLLYFAQIYIGEGGTMATEAATLGTPAILINPEAKNIGNHHIFQDKYKLLYFYSTPKSAKNKIMQLTNKKNLKHIWQNRKKHMINDHIDITKFMIEEILSNNSE
jgi:predicted glycosyltransferase